MINNQYKIGEFAVLMNVSVKSLRRWDKSGILVADRSDGCHRYYNQKHIDQLTQLQSENSSKLTRKKIYRYKDITGERFGKLLVLERVDDWIGANGHRHIQWLCQCDCSNTCIVKGSSLNSGYNKSCGCSQYGDSHTKKMWEQYHDLNPDETLAESLLNINVPTSIIRNPDKKNVGKFQDLSGNTYGLWSVLKRGNTRYYKNGGQAICWECQCECGVIKEVPGRDLKSGASQSCGCMANMSRLEYHVRQCLDADNIPYKYQHKYVDLQGVGGKLLSYDFILYDDYGNELCAIECQGEQHYRPIKKFGGAKQLLKQQIHDQLKKEYALNVLHIPLYEVTYVNTLKSDVYNVLKSCNVIK